jgi:hypothetical protein
MIDTKCPHPNPEYQMELLDGEVVFFHQSGLKIMHSNRTGALIWQLCDGQRTVAEIIQLLSAAYPEFAAEIHSDVPEILTTLATYGAITWM